MLVLCFLRPELVFLRLRSDKQTNKQTNKQTDTQTDYCNPSAHARRGLIIIIILVRCKASWGEPEQFYKQLYVAMCVEIVKQ